MNRIVLLLAFIGGVYAEQIPAELLAPHKSAWLEIPHTTYHVLIELQQSDAAPWVKTIVKEENGKRSIGFKTNFSFIDPSWYDNKTRTFKHLPQGLYHWQDDAALLAGQEIKRLGNKATSDAGEHNFLVRPFPKRLTGYALNAAGNAYINLLKDGATWHSSLARDESFNVLGRLIADQRLPKWDTENIEISIASGNVMCNTNSKGSLFYRGGMPAEKREHFFNQLFEENNIIAETDVLCLQEAQRASHLKLDFNGYEIIVDANNIGLLTAFNPNKFEAIEHVTKNVTDSHGGFLVLVLETKELDTRRRIGIINVCVPHSTQQGKQLSVTAREQQAREIARFINSKPAISYWLIAGTLPFDGLDAKQYQAVADMFAESNLAINPNTLNKATSASSTKEDARTYAQYDYLFVTPTFNVSAFQQYPIEQEQLLAQSPTDERGNYCSTHAFLRTSLTFVEDEEED